MAGTPQDRKTKRSGNPARKGVTSATAWRKAGGADTTEFELPSGNVARLRLVTPEAFMAQGLIPDSLTPIISDMVENKQGKRPSKKVKKAEVGQLLGDSKNFRAMLEMMDRVLVFAVVEPQVEMPPACRHKRSDGHVCGLYNMPDIAVHHDKSNPDYHDYDAAEKDPARLYADEVDFNDKSAILEFSMGGGTGDLEPFREAARASVGTVPDQS